MFYTQSNTKPGHRPFVAAAGLAPQAGVSQEAKLLVLSSNAGVPTVALPTAVTDIPQFVLVDDGATSTSPANLAGQQVEAQPLTPGENIRVRAYGAGTAGTKLMMADPTANAGAQAGMVTALTATPGSYIEIGVAEEDFVDGQLVLLRPSLQLVKVKVADSLTALTFTTPTAAEVQALRNAVHAALQTLGLMV